MKKHIKLLLTTPRLNNEWQSDGILIITDNHTYSFFPGHTETVLLLINATISLYIKENEKIVSKAFIENGICNVHNDVVTCLAERVTLS